MTQDIEQKIYNLIKTRRNVFIHGMAGTGKSTLLRKIRSRYHNSVVVAPTGIASLNVQGQTIHSFFRLKPGYMDSTTVGDINEYMVYLFTTLEVLIIDEISMVRSDLLDAVDMTLRNARSDMRPFGGVRVLLFGDTGQLPPVVTGEEKQFFSDSSHLFYKSNAFIQGNFEFIELTTIYRQTDPFFIGFLGQVRAGNVDPSLLDEFNNQVTITSKLREGNCVVLCTTRAMTDKINTIRFNQLDEREIMYRAEIDNFKATEYPTNEELKLKVGAKVVLLNNDMEKRWVNGTIGYISYINKETISVLIGEEEYDIDQYRWEKIAYKVKGGEMMREVVGYFKQYPLKLAWSITTHKSQGMTLDEMHLDLTHPIFEVGQLYVSLSRARTLEGLSLSRPLLKTDILPNPYIYQI